jgi:DNA end-binding protein Ku
MHEREYVAALRPLGNLICLSTVHFGSEVLDPPHVAHAKHTPERDLDAATELIKSLTGDFEPERYANEYHQRVRHMLERKEQGKEVVDEPQAEPEDEAAEFKGRNINLTEMLEASLRRAKSHAKETGGGSSKRGGSKRSHAHAAASHAHQGHHEHRRRKSA